MARRRILLPVVLIAILAVPASAGARGPSGAESFQPDGWIKLCGLSLGCTIDPLPHPWLGRDVYNTSGHRQTIAVDINEGEGVRFWIVVQNDGDQADTLTVRGCRGNRVFEVNSVLIGKHKRPSAGATNVTARYKAGTLTFDLDPGERAVFTLNVITHFDKGVTYECETAIGSQAEPSAEDTVVARMTTF